MIDGTTTKNKAIQKDTKVGVEFMFPANKSHPFPVTVVAFTQEEANKKYAEITSDAKL